MGLISQKFTLAEAINKQEAFSAFVLTPSMVAVSPLSTLTTEIRGVASSDVSAPLSCELNGAALAVGAIVSITDVKTGVGFDELFATSVMTAETLHVPSLIAGRVHTRSDVVALAVNEH